MRRWIFACLVIGATLGVALFVYALLIEPRSLKVRSVSTGQGDRALRFVVVSDLHVGGFHVGPDRVRELVEQINALKPDIVLMPGDFIDGHDPISAMTERRVGYIDAGLKLLGEIESPIIASLGNHDSWFGKSEVKRRLETLGVIVLDNKSHSWGDICFVGLADFDTDRPSFRPFETCPQESVIITLMHSPDTRSLLPSGAKLGVAGHTHGGQVNLPFFGRAVTSTRCGKACAYGWIQQDPPVFVSAGVGTSILPIRFRSPPEIVEIMVFY